MERSRNSLQPNASASSYTVEPVLTTSALLLSFSVPFSFPPFSLLWPLLQETILTALSGHSMCSSYPAFLPLLHCLTLHFSMTPNSKTQVGSCHLRLLMCFSRDMLNSCWCCWELFISVGLRNHSLKAKQMTLVFQNVFCMFF